MHFNDAILEVFNQFKHKSEKLKLISTSKTRRTVGKSRVSKWQRVWPTEAKPIAAISDFLSICEDNLLQFQLFRIMFELVKYC